MALGEVSGNLNILQHFRPRARVRTWIFAQSARPVSISALARVRAHCSGNAP